MAAVSTRNSTTRRGFYIDDILRTNFSAEQSNSETKTSIVDNKQQQQQRSVASNVTTTSRTARHVIDVAAVTSSHGKVDTRPQSPTVSTSVELNLRCLTPINDVSNLEGAGGDCVLEDSKNSFKKQLCCSSSGDKSPKLPLSLTGSQKVDWNNGSLVESDCQGSVLDTGRQQQHLVTERTASQFSVSRPNPAAAVDAAAERDVGLSQDVKDVKLPAWIYCTRYSDRPSAGRRMRRPLRCDPSSSSTRSSRRQRTSYSASQLSELRQQFNECRYVTDERRHQLALKLGLDSTRIKIWFQNKRANEKKLSGVKNELALRLMEDGLYNHQLHRPAQQQQQQQLDSTSS